MEGECCRVDAYGGLCIYNRLKGIDFRVYSTKKCFVYHTKKVQHSTTMKILYTITRGRLDGRVVFSIDPNLLAVSLLFWNT